MIGYVCRYTLALGLLFAIGGCVPQATISIPSETVSSTTSTPTSIARATDTPRPENIPTIFPTSSAIQPILPEPAYVSGWYPIPDLADPNTVNLSTAQAFEGLKIPPLPDEVVMEFAAIQPYGEVPADTIFYRLFLMRKGNTRMLWLGIPFKENALCCGQETPHRIYDSIPFPPIETNSVLIPFICRHNQTPDIFLLVVAERPENGASATNIRYAWRIDQGTTSLKPASTEGIECSPNW